jgi:hypothetical protein
MLVLSELLKLHVKCMLSANMKCYLTNFLFSHS